MRSWRAHVGPVPKYAAGAADIVDGFDYAVSADHKFASECRRVQEATGCLSAYLSICLSIYHITHLPPYMPPCSESCLLHVHGKYYTYVFPMPSALLHLRTCKKERLRRKTRVTPKRSSFVCFALFAGMACTVPATMLSRSAEKTMLYTHFLHCLGQALNSRQEARAALDVSHGFHDKSGDSSPCQELGDQSMTPRKQRVPGS